jgi:hypothetical protein
MEACTVPGGQPGRDSAYRSQYELAIINYSGRTATESSQRWSLELPDVKLLEAIPYRIEIESAMCYSR